MIKIYDKNNNFIKQIDRYKDMRIEKEINKLDLLFFNIPKQLGNILEEEGYIETKDHGKFIIKEKNLGSDDYEIVARYDLEELNDWVESKAYVTETPKQMLDDLLQGKGWSVISSIITKRTVTATNVSMIGLVKQVVDTFNAEVIFDNVTKTIYVEEELGSDKGVYFHNELNLRRLNISSDTYDFATRMIPLGFDDMGIEFINDGKNYVENHTYSEKIITVVWQDERYTVLENLKDDAIKKLEVLAKPRRSYTCDIVNLSKASKGEYSILDYGIGDTITLIEKASDTKEKQRIMKMVIYPDNPLSDTVDIENRPRMLGQKEQEEIDSLRAGFTSTKASLELLEDSVLARVSTIEGTVEEITDEMDDRFGETEARITDNTAELEMLSTEISTKVSQTEYDRDYNEINSNHTDFKQEYNQFVAGVKVGGGNNLILNSVGYGELNYWKKNSGNIDYTNDSTWILEGIAKHGWVIATGEIEQSINLPANKKYTLSGRVKKSTNAGTFLVGLYEGSNLIHEVMTLGSETYDGEFSYEFETNTEVEYRLVVKASGISSNSPLELTDLMLAQGENYNYWSQANGESYTLNVKMDGQGISVYNADGQGKTVMSPDEFAGYYNDEKIFTLNQDITEVMGLKIKERGLFIPPVKFVQTNDSLDIVWTGVD